MFALAISQVFRILTFDIIGGMLKHRAQRMPTGYSMFTFHLFKAPICQKRQDAIMGNLRPNSSNLENGKPLFLTSSAQKIKWIGS